MGKNIKKTKAVGEKKVNGFTQSMSDCDYNLVEQYQEEQIAEQQMLDEQGEEPIEVHEEPAKDEAPEPSVSEPSVEEETEQPATPVVTPPFQADVTNDVVEDIFTALKNRPTSAVVKVRILDGYLMIKVIITFKFKITREYETFADKQLLSLIMRAMRGINVSMDDYGRNLHILKYTVEDPRIEIFRLFMESTLRCRISTDYISRDGSGKKCIFAEFTIAERMTCQFSLEKTKEVNEIFNKAIA